MCGTICNLLMQRKEADTRVEGLARFGSEADDLESGSVDLFRQLVDGDVRRRANEDLTGVHLGKMIDDRGGGHGLAGTRRTLDETKRLLQDALDRVHLRMIKFRKARSREAFRHLRPEGLGLDFVTKQFVVDVSADTLFVDGKRLHRELHPVEAGGFPDKVGGEVMHAVGGHAFGTAELQANFVGHIVGNLDDMPNTLPRLM